MSAQIQVVRDDVMDHVNDPAAAANRYFAPADVWTWLQLHPRV